MSKDHQFTSGHDVNKIDVAVGARLIELRQMSDMTASSLAGKVGLNLQDLHNLETGRTRIGASLMWKFCRVFGIRPKGFYDGVEVSLLQTIPEPSENLQDMRANYDS